MNERRLVEDLVLVGMLINVVKRGVSDLADPISVSTLRHLQAAAQEMIDQAPQNSRQKLMRRVQAIGRRRVHHHVPIGTPIVLLGLAAYHILEHLIEEGYVVIGTSSPLSQALDAILPSLEPAAAIDGNMSQGRAMAVSMFRDLREEGLFRDVLSLA